VTFLPLPLEAVTSVAVGHHQVEVVRAEVVQAVEADRA
jgi:hypothetical protein